MTRPHGRPSISSRAVPLPTRAIAVLLGMVLAAGCSTDDGRRLADPDPDLTRVTTTAPTASGEASRGGAASALAIPVSSRGPTGLSLTAPDFEPGAALPVEHTCDGADRPPTLLWTGNADERPLALTVRDADADGIVHWLVTDLTASSGRLDGAPTQPGIQRPNGFGVEGWTGPCPADDLEHRYVFTLYRLDEALDLPATAGAAVVVQELERLHDDAATTLATYAAG